MVHGSWLIVMSNEQRFRVCPRASGQWLVGVPLITKH
jgi:hypothetical protein